MAAPTFNPHRAKCEELGALVFLHPQGTSELDASGRLRGSGLLSNTIGNPLETTIALSHLIFDGTLDRYPGLRICAAHGGGFLPSYANRSDAVTRTFPAGVGTLPKKSPMAYLPDGQLFFDTLVFTPEALRHLVAEVGAEHMVNRAVRRSHRALTEPVKVRAPQVKADRACELPLRVWPAAEAAALPGPSEDCVDFSTNG